MALTRTETELSDLGRDALAPTNVDLSVVIPLYNEEESIDSAVQEVLDVLRTLPLDFELILVNDGSTDGARVGTVAMRPDDSRVDAFCRYFAGSGALLTGRIAAIPASRGTVIKSRIRSGNRHHAPVG